MFEAFGSRGWCKKLWVLWKLTNCQLLVDRSSSTCRHVKTAHPEMKVIVVLQPFTPTWCVMILHLGSWGFVHNTGHQALGLNEFGDLVVTSRGVHLIQRIGWVTTVSPGSADRPKLGSKMGRCWGGGKSCRFFGCFLWTSMSQLPIASMHWWHCSIPK